MTKRHFEYGGCWLVKRRDTPNYHIYWCKPGTRRVQRKSTGTGVLDTAKRKLVEFADQQARPLSQRPDEIHLSGVLARYVETTLEGRASQDTARIARDHLMEFFDRRGIQDVGSLTLDLQDQYVTWRRRSMRARGHGASNGTIKRELDVLRAALKEFWKRGYLAEVPYIRSLPSPPPRQRYLSLEEVDRLIAACTSYHLWLYVMLALHTLQRPGAILGLRVEMVDLKNGRIDFLPEGKLQSNKRRPVVPVTATLRPILEEAIRRSESGYLVEYEGLPVLTVRRALVRTCRKIGIEGVSPYTLRHTGATWAAARGVPMRQIAGMMGHSETTTTERYAKHSPDFLQDAAGALDDLFGRRIEPRTAGHRSRRPDVRASRAPMRLESGRAAPSPGVLEAL